MATKTKTNNHRQTLRWGASYALEETPSGIINKTFTEKLSSSPLSADRKPALPVTTRIQAYTPPQDKAEKSHPESPPSHAHNQPHPQPNMTSRTQTPMTTLNQTIAQISDDVKTIQSLDELTAYTRDFPYTMLKNTATQLVFGDGQSSHPQAMLVGEAPGADEDIQGKPFVGKSGQLLDRILASINLSRTTNLYIANVIPWRPPGNRTPTEEEIKLLTPVLSRHIELINPGFLILAGATAIRAILGDVGGISRIRGRAQDYTTLFEQKTCAAMPIYHPSYLLRSPGQKAKAWEDMLQIKLHLLDK